MSFAIHSFIVSFFGVVVIDASLFYASWIFRNNFPSCARFFHHFCHHFWQRHVPPNFTDLCSSHVFFFKIISNCCACKIKQIQNNNWASTSTVFNHKSHQWNNRMKHGRIYCCSCSELNKLIVRNLNGNEYENHYSINSFIHSFECYN